MKFTTVASGLAAAGLTIAKDCPAPGTTNGAGDYSCNPAHQYPSGQLCVLKDGCYYLEGTGLILPSTTGSPEPYPTSGSPEPYPTAACPAPGTTNSAGDYSCNPAHQYPSGQLCVLKDGCYYLEGTGLVIPTLTSSSKPYPTAACPAPGTTNEDGEYSCNPAHQYPSGQLCVLKSGCYYLEGTGLVVPSKSSSPKPSSTAACPAPGTTNAAGNYSCNPAHQYPAGQVCVLKKGCYYLEDSKPATTSVNPTPKPSIVVVAGGSRHTAFGGLAAAIALCVALM